MPTQTTRRRVIIVGVGGVSCSGKTTLAKVLRQCLPDSFIVHQDDFAPPEEQVPIHPVHGIPDWDDAPGAILWPKMAQELVHVKKTGAVSNSHFSHDHLNEQKSVPVDEKTLQRWRSRFQQMEAKLAEKGEKVQWVLVDGFLLYWYPAVYQTLDVRIFIREAQSVVKQRRTSRSYNTAVIANPEGSVWQDPPDYWENIVWPAYVRAHQDIFKGGDVERGQSNGKVPNLVVLDGQELGMTELLERACQRIVEAVGPSFDISAPIDQ